MGEQYHFNFQDADSAFEMFYRKRCGEILDIDGKKIKRPGNPKIILVVCYESGRTGYWIEEKNRDTESNSKNIVYRSLKSVRELELAKLWQK